MLDTHKEGVPASAKLIARLINRVQGAEFKVLASNYIGWDTVDRVRVPVEVEVNVGKGPEPAINGAIVGVIGSGGEPVIGSILFIGPFSLVQEDSPDKLLMFTCSEVVHTRYKEAGRFCWS